MLQGIQSPPQTLDLRSHVLVRKNEVSGHPRPPLCKGKGKGKGDLALGFQDTLSTVEPVSSSMGTHVPLSGAALPILSKDQE